jgi:hypothetical protein
MTTKTTTPTPRFKRVGRRGLELDLATPVAPILVEVDEGLAARIAQHEKLAGRAGELRAKASECAIALERARAEHGRKTEEAVLAGKRAPSAQPVATAERKLAETEEELAAFEVTLPKSADNLLAAAGPHLDQGIARAREQEERCLKRAGELLLAVRSALGETQAFADQALWLEKAQGSAHVEPYRDQRAHGELARLASAFDRVWAEAIDKRARWQAEHAAERAREEAERHERERREAHARREDEQQRVVIEDGVITHRGGVPVRRGQFGGVEEVEAREEGES